MADPPNIEATRAAPLAIAWLIGAALLVLCPTVQARPAQRADDEQATGLPAVATETASKTGSCPRSVLFRNQSSSDLRLRVGSEFVRGLGKGVVARFCTGAERVRWQVRARAGWQIGGEADLRDLRQREVLISAPDASLRVTNRSGEDQRLSLDGRDLGVVHTDELWEFGNIAPGQHRILARGLHSSAWRPLRIVASAGRVARAQLGVPATVVDVHNTATEAAGLRIDGVDFGTIPGASSVRVLGLCGGRHEAVLIGQPSGQLQRQVLRVARAGEPRRPTTPVTLLIVNATGEVLEIPEGMRTFGVEIAPNATPQWTLPPAVSFGITLTGRDSGLTYHFDVRTQDFGKREWRVIRSKATVRLANRTGQELAVLLPDQTVAHLAPDKTVVVRVSAGRVKITANLAGEKRQLSTGLFLQANADATWQIRSRETAITIVNGHGESVHVLLDGLQRAEIRAHGDLRMDVAPGRHRIEVRAPVSHTVAAATFEMADGQLRQAYFDPPDGAVRVDNGAGAAPVVLLIRGRKLAELPAGASVAVDVIPGRLTAEVRDEKSEVSDIWTGSVAPAQQVDLAPPRATADVELENTATRSLRLTLDQGVARDLAVGAVWRVTAVKPGTHMLTIEGAGQPLRRRIDVDARRPLVRLRLRDLP